MKYLHRVPFAAVPLVAVLTATSAGAHTATLQPATSTVVSTPAVFRDDKGTLAFAIQLKPDHADTGKFDFKVVGTGYYEGTVHPKGEREKGEIVRVDEVVSASFYAETASGAQPVSLHVEGVFDTDDSTATVEVWVRGRYYHLKAKRADLQGATRLAQKAIGATVTRDWATVYSELEPSLVAKYSQTQFIALMASQVTPTMTRASLAGKAKEAEASGYTYVRQPITLDATLSGGSSRRYTANVLLVLEGGKWYFLGTDVPVPS